MVISDGILRWLKTNALGLNTENTILIDASFYQIEYLSVLPKYSVFCQQFEVREILASCWTSAANLTDEKI
jgi:hypothetical protein